MTTETKESPKDRWSEDGQVYFTGGYGYGLTDTLWTTCLGKEEDTKREATTDGIRETDMVGASNDGTTGGKQKTIRQSPPRKRLTLRSSKQKGKDLFRR